METNSHIVSAFCGNALEVQNCRESPSALKFLPAENRTELPCSQRSKAEDDRRCWQWGRHGKGHAPKRGGASPGTSSQLWSCSWESVSVRIVQMESSMLASIQCAVPFEALLSVPQQSCREVRSSLPLSWCKVEHSASSPPLALLKHLS